MGPPLILRDALLRNAPQDEGGEKQPLYSIGMFATLMTLAHFATSRGRISDISPGEISTIGMPWRCIAAFTLSLRAAVCKARWSLSITAGGVLAGANSAPKASASTPGTPD